MTARCGWMLMQSAAKAWMSPCICLGADCGCELRLALRSYLERSFALAGVVRDLDLAEVEGHAGYALRDAVWRGQAAEIRCRREGAGLNHRESRSSRSEGMVMTAGAMIMARKTRARTRSGSIWVVSCAACVAASKSYDLRMLGWCE
jgi:hypothetical protein